MDSSAPFVVPADVAAVVTPPVNKRKDRLLVLDVSGLLCAKVADPAYQSPHGHEVINQTFYTIVLRPGARAFLSSCFEQYAVGFFSSSMYGTVNPILDLLLTDEQKELTLFRWYRDRTEYDPDTNDFQTIKRLQSIWLNPVVNYDRRYNQWNTLLCDDSVDKTRFNDHSNILLFESFCADQPRDDHLGRMVDQLRQRFDLLGMLQLH